MFSAIKSSEKSELVKFRLTMTMNMCNKLGVYVNNNYDMVKQSKNNKSSRFNLRSPT